MDTSDIAAATLGLVIAKVERDRQRGIVLWMVDCDDGRGDTRVAITADPEQLVLRLTVDTVAGMPDLPVVGVPAKLTPLSFRGMPEAQLAALVTLPRDRFHTADELRAHGVELRPKEATPI